MGIFSSKTVVNVSSNVNQLIANVPKSDNKVVTQAILTGDSIVNAALRKHTSQMKSKVEKLNSYAKSAEYIHGLPTVVSNFSSSGFPRFYSVTYLNFDPAQPLPQQGVYYWTTESNGIITYAHLGQARTNAERDVFNERAMYLQVMEGLRLRIYNNPSLGTYDGYKIESRTAINNAHLTYTTTPYSFSDANGVIYPWDGYTYSVQVFLNGIVFPTSNLRVKSPIGLYQHGNQIMHIYTGFNIYRKVGISPHTFNETIQSQPMCTVVLDMPKDNPHYSTSGLFPINVDNAVAEMTYPIIPIKYNGNYINDGTEEARVVTKALKKMSLNKNEIINSLAANPDSNLIDDAYITFGFTPHTIVDEDQYIAVATILQQLKNHSIQYYDERNNVIKFTEGEFEYHLEFKRIEKTEQVGTGYSKVYWSDGMVNVGAPYYTTELAGDSYEYVEKYNQYEQDYLQIKIPKDANTLTVYTLVGATGFYTVNTGLGVRYSTAKPNTEDFFLPLFENTLDFIPSIRHDRILMYSLVMVTNSIQYNKVKWYQRSFFKFLLTAIAVFLIVVNPATGTFISTILAGGTPALFAIAKVVGMYVISGVVVEALIERLGKLGVVLAIIALVVTAQMSGQISSTLDKAFKVFSSAVDTYSVYQQDLLQDTIKLNEEFTVEYDKRKTELDELSQFAEYGTGIDWLKVSNAVMPSKLSLNETPSDFYTRTSTVINLPDITYSSVNDYYTLNLQLPKGGTYERTE